MTFGPGNMVSVEDVAIAVVRGARSAVPKGTDQATLGDALMRAGVMILRHEVGGDETARRVLVALKKELES